MVGRLDKQWGEALHVFVVPRGGAMIDADTITQNCRAELAGFKVPRGITFIDELPRNASGKVLKTSLRTLANELDHA